MISSFYASVESNFGKEPATAASALQTTGGSSVSVFYENQRAIRPTLPRRQARVLGFIRRHPFAAGAASTAFLAGMALLGSALMKPGVDENPAAVHLNPGQETIEILNSGNKVIWSLPTVNIADQIAYQHETGFSQTVVADLNGDKFNEVICSAPLANEGGANRYALKIYGKGQTLVSSVFFHDTVRYLERLYERAWNPAAVYVERASSNGARNIITEWSIGRSPTVFTRHSPDGTITGRYWHFGNLSGQLIQLEKDSAEVLALCGVNDATDSLRTSTPVLTILEPRLLTGNGRSTACDGYRLPVSLAELYYIRFPLSSMSRALNSPNFAYRLRKTDGGLFTLWLGNSNMNPPPTEIVEFEYYFSPDMRVIDVKGSNPSNETYRKLVERGVLNGSIDREYLDELINGVEYWDGEQWVRKPMKVRHDLESRREKK
jgi:hypothetical protein